MIKIEYIGHTGDRIDLLGSPYLLQTGDLFTRGWNYALKASKVARLTPKSKERKLYLTVSPTNESYAAAANRLCEILEKDVISGKPGQLFVNGYALSCYVIASQSKDWEHLAYTDLELTLIPVSPLWIREKTFAFLRTSDYETDNKHYRGYRYPWRYANGLNNAEVINDHFAAANFKMIIYGYVVNPQVVIGGYIYQLYTILEEGEYITIDSIAKTVQKVMVDGRIVNVFNDRDKRNSVFRPIPPGRQQVGWSGQFDWELTIYEERGEPKWD